MPADPLHFPPGLPQRLIVLEGFLQGGCRVAVFAAGLLDALLPPGESPGQPRDPILQMGNEPDIRVQAACRFGYLGTSYSALRKAEAGAGKSVLVNGGTGTLGVGAVLNALAMGATKALAMGRDRELLERVRQIDPRRVRVLAHGDETVGDWVRENTNGLGADIFIDAVGPGAPHGITLAGIDALRRGGKMVDIGGMSEPLPLEMFKLMCFQISVIGSLWFSVAEGQDMAEMAEAGTLDLSVFEHEIYPMSQVNEALEAVDKRRGGFTNVVVVPGS